MVLISIQGTGNEAFKENNAWLQSAANMSIKKGNFFGSRTARIFFLRLEVVDSDDSLEL